MGKEALQPMSTEEQTYQLMRNTLLDDLEGRKESYQLLHWRKIHETQIPLALDHEQTFAYLRNALALNNTFAAAEILSQVPITQLPEDIIQTIRPVPSNIDLGTILPYYANWSLCPAAENKMETAIQQDDIILLGELVIKFNGKIVGMSEKNILLPDNHILLAGIWISPVTYGRRHILSAHQQGIRVMEESPEKTWVINRACTSKKLLPKITRAKNYLQETAQQLRQEKGLEEYKLEDPIGLELHI